MPVTYVRGNIFESPAETLVNTVNTVGVMGKGIAYEFKRLYPEMFKQYRYSESLSPNTGGSIFLTQEIPLYSCSTSFDSHADYTR